ncbi:MAG: sugar transferase [Solirubrobacteraceae bacterium]
MSGRVEIARQATDQALPLGGVGAEQRRERSAPTLRPRRGWHVHEDAELDGAIPWSRAHARGSRASIRRDALYRWILVSSDFTSIVMAATVAASATDTQLRPTWGKALAVLAFLLVAKLLGLYDRDALLLNKTTLEEVPRLFNAATLYVLLTWLASGRVATASDAVPEMLALWLSLAVLLVLSRVAGRALAQRLAPTERCLFIGPAAAAQTLRARLSGGGTNARLVASLDLDKVAAWTTRAYDAARLAEIRDLARALDIDRAIVIPRSPDGEETLDLLRTLKAVGVRVSLVPRLLEAVGTSVEFDDLHGVPVMGVRRFDLSRGAAALKRCFDVSGACLVLLATAPLTALIAFAIRLDGPGPLFFRQRRVGRDGKQFWMVKFRTMVPDADERKEGLRDRNEALEGLFKIPDDPRVTRVGCVLRRASLDELPQLLNVLRGEMSLVGPRPLVLDEDDRIEGWDRRRLDLMPGITGPWQILGPTRVPLREMGTMDYLYVANWSLWSDVKIILRTIRHVLARRGL